MDIHIIEAMSVLSIGDETGEVSEWLKCCPEDDSIFRLCHITEDTPTELREAFAQHGYSLGDCAVFTL
jgi:hypothetical protein